MDKYLRDKLKVILFFSMIMVVFLHFYNSVVKSLYGNIILNKFGVVPPRLNACTYRINIIYFVQITLSNLI